MEDGRKIYRPQLDYSLPMLDETIVSSDYQQYYPLNSPKDNSNPIEFNIGGNSAQFIDLFNSFLYIRLCVKRQDGTKLDSTDVVAPANLMLHMMFKNCTIHINDILISDCSNYYPYIAWLNSQLSFGQGEKGGQMTCELYYKDLDFDNNTIDNASFKARQEYAKNSNIFELLGKLQTPLFLQKRYIPPGLNLTIKLDRSAPEFALSCKNDTKAGYSGCPYSIYIEDCSLYVRKHQVSQSVYNAVIRGQAKNFNLPIRKTQVKSFALPIGSLDHNGEVIFNHQLPDLVLVGLVDSSAFSGKLSKSAVNFAGYGLSSISLSVNDVTYRTLKLDFDNNMYLLSYRTIMQAEEYNAIGNYLDRSDYLKGSNIYLFDLRPSYVGTFQSQQQGQVKLDLHFKAPIQQSLAVVIYGQFQGLVQINQQNGGVLTE